MYNPTSDSVLFENCTFTDNEAAASGGGIYAKESVQIKNSEFRSNEAILDGGAIRSEQKDVDVSDSLFLSNTATGDGGAISTDYDFSSTRSLFDSNTGFHGGAVFSDEDVTITESYFGLNLAGGDGGAIRGQGELLISNSTFFKNEAGDEGGVFWTGNFYTTPNSFVIYSSFVDNEAATAGGTLYFQGDELDLFGNLMVSSENKEQIAGDLTGLNDFGANVSSFATESAFDDPTSTRGVSFSSLQAGTPTISSSSVRPFVPFGDLSPSKSKVTQALIDNYDNNSGQTAPSKDQQLTNRTVDFFAGAEMIAWVLYVPPAPTAPPVYSGPLITGVGQSNSAGAFSISSNQQITISGQRLSGVTKAFIDGKECTVVSASSEEVVIEAPANLAAGEYDLVIQSSIGNLTYLDAFVVKEEVIEAETYDQMKAWTKRISDTQVKVYVKYPTVGQKLRISHQTGGSGEYQTVFVKTIESETDSALITNANGSYVVRTIDLDEINRIRVTVGDSTEVQVRYNS